MPKIGFRMPLEQKEKISIALKKAISEGRFFSLEHRKRISESKKGVKFTEEHKAKLKYMEKGHTPWNKGKVGYSTSKKGKKQPPMREETKKKISLALRGENSPFWKGGLRKKDYLERRRFQKSMQKLIFERDNYTCQLCGIRGVDLQVDHIQSWAEYVELRFSMDNCRTLCAKCHYQITFRKPMPENIKGWGHNLFRKESEVL